MIKHIKLSHMLVLLSLSSNISYAENSESYLQQYPVLRSIQQVQLTQVEVEKGKDRPTFIANCMCGAKDYKFDFIKNIAYQIDSCEKNKVLAKHKIIAIQSVPKTQQYLIQLDNKKQYQLNFIKQNRIEIKNEGLYKDSKKIDLKLSTDQICGDFDG